MYKPNVGTAEDLTYVLECLHASFRHDSELYAKVSGAIDKLAKRRSVCDSEVFRQKLEKDPAKEAKLSLPLRDMLQVVAYLPRLGVNVASKDADCFFEILDATYEALRKYGAISFTAETAKLETNCKYTLAELIQSQKAELN